MVYSWGMNKTYAVSWLGKDGKTYREEFSGEDGYFDAETYYVAVEQDGNAYSAMFTEIDEKGYARILLSFNIATQGH